MAAANSETSPIRIADTIPVEALGIKIHHCPPTPCADIVAVHGVGADPRKTWNRGTVNWLVDNNMLHAEVPEARIMAFNYDSQYIGVGGNKLRTEEIARDLLYDLMEERKDCEERPLVFIGHSAGGLIIEKAILSARVFDWAGSVVQNTSGVILLGTPHRGAGKISAEQLISTIIAASIEVHVETVSLMQVGNDLLRDTVRQFAEFAKHHKSYLDVSCFWETKMTDVGAIIGHGGLREFAVDEESACIEGCSRHFMNADHFQLSKFSGVDDNNWKKLRREIKRHVEHAGGILVRRNNGRIDFNVPFHKQPTPRGKFTGRQAELEKIESHFRRKESLQKSVVIICGSGGLGKSRLALEYFNEHRTRYTARLALDCSTSTTIAYGFRKIHEQIGLRHNETASSSDEQKIATEVFNWLNYNDNHRWLLWLDNSGNGISDGLGDAALKIISEAVHGYFLVTTQRHRGVSSEWLHIDLQPLGPDDSFHLLQDCTSNMEKHLSKDSCETLLKHLHGLPLALITVGVFLNMTNSSVERYTKSFERIKSKLFVENRHIYNNDGDHSASLDATFRLTYDHIRRESTAAADLLCYMAYLDASDFTLDLIQDSRKFPPPERLKVLVQSEDALLNALGYLRNYSMIQFGQIEHYYIHGVIHRWAFEILTEGNDIEMLHRAFHCVGSKAKERHREGYWATALSLAPHTSRLVFFIKRGLLDLYQKTDIFWQDSVIGLVKLLTAQNFELEMAKRALFFIITGTHVSSPQAMDFENVQSLKDNFKNPVSFSKQAMISLGNIWHQEKNYNQAADLFLRMMLIVQDINSGTYVKDFTRVCKNYCTNVSLGGLRSSLVPSALSPESKAIYDFLKAMEEGDKLSISGDYQNAIRVFEGLRDDSATYPTELNDVRIGVNLGIAYTGSGELQLAKDTLIRILPHSQANRGNCSETLLILKELGNVYNQEGQTYIGSGNIDKSTEAFKTAKDYFRKAMDGYGNCKGLKNRSFLEVVADLCLVQVNMGDFDEAMILFQEYADEIKQMLPVIDFMVRAKISNRARGARNRG